MLNRLYLKMCVCACLSIMLFTEGNTCTEHYYIVVVSINYLWLVLVSSMLLFIFEPEQSKGHYILTWKPITVL